MEKAPGQFSTPEEEIKYLKEQIAVKERELLNRAPEADRLELETVAKQELREYATYEPETVLSKESRLDAGSLTTEAGRVEIANDKVSEVMEIASEKGIKNALSVLEKIGDAFTADEVHRHLVEMLKSGRQVRDLKEGVPPWQVLHMTLFEVTMPEVGEIDKERSVRELISIMQQFYAGMQNVGQGKGDEHLALEIAVSDKSSDIIFYVAIPNQYIDLFEKQLFSLFPHASLTECKHDYNIFVDEGVSEVSTVQLVKHAVFPIRLSDTFESDPLNVLLNAFSKIEHEGGGASVQFMIRGVGQKYTSQYQSVLRKVRDGMKIGEAISRTSLSGEIFHSAREAFFTKPDKQEDTHGQTTVDQDTIEVLDQKVSQPIVATNIRIAVSAKSGDRAKQILGDIEATFNQFENTKGNRFKFSHPSGTARKQALKAFSFREFSKNDIIPLSYEELSLLAHFPSQGIASSPEFKQSRAATAPAPQDMPGTGTLIGHNDHRGSSKPIYITEEDRLRHFYVIGQTGTGKSVFLKNVILQDIAAGHGVCMIDPHGSDIEDVLASIPREREDDVIYFDPSHLDHVIGLNMLEYDPQYPEQKTFVVNELFSIFQRLYGGNPESMGPMFEQYFRNATLLVMEDPESGNTLMDISRVMSDSTYRRQKLERAKNPVVVQFWKDIATKAGGEASLENIVPYIVSKFDVFTANDYIRPIIGQQHSSFNFRTLMDERKILLVNLSKGRLGEINSNLLGMIVVGKILMAALSRVDDSSKSFPPFFLHIDEFQNVTTNSITSILSEARKYKLGLTVAHQFIAQLEEGIRDAVFGNVGSVATFRVGTEDAEFLEKQFSPTFAASDLMNLPNFHAYMRVLANNTPTKPFSVKTLEPPERRLESVADLRLRSLEQHARPRAEVEKEIKDRYQS